MQIFSKKEWSSIIILSKKGSNRPIKIKCCQNRRILKITGNNLRYVQNRDNTIRLYYLIFMLEILVCLITVLRNFS